jgi:hypothetical protein
MKNKKQDNPGDEKITIDMPEVKDIPGQEHVKPPRMREMEDTTISSDGEEGKGILDDLNETDELTDDSTNVSSEERKLLEATERSYQAPETKAAKDATLDKTDGEDPLNEGGEPLDMGEDLDIPGSELDDENEEIGEEDEENNPYSNPEDQ